MRFINSFRIGVNILKWINLFNVVEILIGTTMNRKTFERMIHENITWLKKNTKHSLEQMHILQILKDAPNRYYGKSVDRTHAERIVKNFVKKNKDIIEWVES